MLKEEFGEVEEEVEEGAVVGLCRKQPQ